jgi:predicted TIM-barrel fold metal-dependent hydrolase
VRLLIVDGHIHIAAERDEDGRPTLDAETLVRLMDGPFLINGELRVVDKALVQPMILPTRRGDPMDHHGYVAEQIHRHPDRLIGCFVFNPALDLDRSLEVLRQLVESGGFRAIKLHPTVHAYVPFRTRAALDPLLREAAELEAPVLVHQGDPPFAYPSQMAPLIEAHPRTCFILAHFGTQRVVLADEAIYVARMNANVSLETSWGDLPRIKEGISAIGSDRIIFGSDCPIQEIGSQLRVIEVLGWESPIGIGLPPHQVEGILGDNLLRLLGPPAEGASAAAAT